MSKCNGDINSLYTGLHRHFGGGKVIEQESRMPYILKFHKQVRVQLKAQGREADESGET